MIEALRNRIKFILTPGPKQRDEVRYYPGVEDEIERGLRAEGFAVEPIDVDPVAYRNYLMRARYERFHNYYNAGTHPNFNEKALEHYLALEFLNLKPGDVYLDIASDSSPVPEIYGDLTGAETWRQDLSYEPGVHGRKIGGDAAALPLPDGFASAMAMHCSFEHFEGDADSRFITEAGRLLRAGGRLVILPLYLFPHFAIQTDPKTWPGWRAPFATDGATLHFAMRYGNRHGRFYDAQSLATRIREKLGPLKLTLYRLMNAHEVDPRCYLRFIAVFTK